MASSSTDKFVIAKTDDWEVFVKGGIKSPFDFIVKYRFNAKRDRTPKHVHLLIDILIKRENNETVTIKLIDHFLEVLLSIEPVKSFPPKLQVFNSDSVEQFYELSKYGDYPVDFLMIIFELIMIQEKTNYPKGTMNLKLIENLKNGSDIFTLVSAATFTGI